jgi:predicted  nucleic acid-binding Zn-ribbon protein
MSYKKQEEYCKKNKLPLFAPEVCFGCRRNIWDKISEKDSENELITGCPYCGYSYVE